MADTTSLASPASSIIAKVKNLSPITAHFAGGIMFLFLFLCIVAVVVYKTNLQESNDEYMASLYPSVAPLTPINESDDKFSYLLRDYYVKTAYNCCSSGDYSGDYVSVGALSTVISQGARCLDFEIYSVGGAPVVSTSSQTEYTLKETYNYVALSEAFDVIQSSAFSGQPKCPVPSDPLFICLRIKSNNMLIFNEIAKLIESKFASRLLDSRYGYGYNGGNLGQVNLTNFMNKVIIIMDETPSTNAVSTEASTLYKKTALFEYVNMIIHGPTSKKTFAEVAAPTPSSSELVEYTKKNIVYVVPERSSKSENVNDTALAITYGCQFIAMSFQSDDANINAYNTKFKDVGSAFILKPDNLRYVPLTIAPPNITDPTRSLTSRMSGQGPMGTTISG